MSRASVGKKSFNPLGPEVADRLATTNPLVTPQQLLEVVTAQLEAGLPGTLKGKARQNVLTFLVETEYHHDLKTHLARAVEKRLAGELPEPETPDNSDRIAQKAKEYAHLAGEEEVEEELVDDIDQPIAPGNMTRLHVAAMDGEMDEVKRLVEQEGARLDVLDNNKWTPAQRANAMGHKAIEKYLSFRLAAAKSGNMA